MVLDWSFPAKIEGSSTDDSLFVKYRQKIR